ncbi:MAG: Holliday junction branch migration protein RuvA [Alphaproteobacteria bacterium]|nr:Holliday junction branch migration protein RuvA [Alphaproteobacteria bacterium]
MIGRLRGEVVDLRGDEATVDVNGVGYRVRVGVNRVSAWTLGEEQILHVSTQVREDAIDLYGFRRPIERDAFEILISMPKIGPKLGLALLDHLGLERLAQAVAADDSGPLVQVPGVGKKTALRLVLDLKDKLPVSFVPDTPAAAPTPTKPSDPLPLALAQLGYRKSEIDRALAGLLEHGLADADTQIRLSASLRILSGSTP